MRLSDAEWVVMNAVWDRPVESSVRDVLEVVEPKTNWAYQTVQTIMVRLTRKGVLDSRLRANTRLYTAELTREQAQRSTLKFVVERAYRGSAAALVQTLLDEKILTCEEAEHLLSTMQAR